MTEAKKSLKRTLVGRVVSDKRAKTVTVLVERRVKHELYGKIVSLSSKYHAHDEKGEYKTGDLIEITPAEGGPTWYLAFTRDAVPEVDIAGGKLVAIRPTEIVGDEE